MSMTEKIHMREVMMATGESLGRGFYDDTLSVNIAANHPFCRIT
jgi:hypothetical protein